MLDIRSLALCLLAIVSTYLLVVWPNHPVFTVVWYNPIAYLAVILFPIVGLVIGIVMAVKDICEQIKLGFEASWEMIYDYDWSLKPKNQKPKHPNQ